MGLRPSLDLLPTIAPLFFEFDIYDKQTQTFVNLEQRTTLLDGTGIETVPMIHQGSIRRSDLDALIGPSKFASQFKNPVTCRTDNLMEGIYLRTQTDGVVTGRAKYVRREFVQKIQQSTHWQHHAVSLVLSESKVLATSLKRGLSMTEQNYSRAKKSHYNKD